VTKKDFEKGNAYAGYKRVMSDSDQEYVASSEDERGHYFNGKKSAGRTSRTKESSSKSKSDPKQNPDGVYVWEGEFQRSWDLVQEDEEGSLTGVVAGLVQSGKRKR
jgi:transcription initiation factor TFIIH subunit 2